MTGAVGLIEYVADQVTDHAEGVPDPAPGARRGDQEGAPTALATGNACHLAGVVGTYEAAAISIRRCAPSLSACRAYRYVDEFCQALPRSELDVAEDGEESWGGEWRR